MKSIGGLDAGLKAWTATRSECSYREGAVCGGLGFVTRHKNGYLLSSLNENESLKYAVQKHLAVKQKPFVKQLSYLK